MFRREKCSSGGLEAAVRALGKPSLPNFNFAIKKS
jgi:hypothetical protein